MNTIQIHKMDDGRFAIFWMNVYGKVDMCVYISRLELESLSVACKTILDANKS